MNSILILIGDRTKLANVPPTGSVTQNVQVEVRQKKVARDMNVGVEAKRLEVVVRQGGDVLRGGEDDAGDGEEERVERGQGRADPVRVRGDGAEGL